HVGAKQAVVGSVSRVLPGVQTIQDLAVRAEALGWAAVALNHAGETTPALLVVTQALDAARQLGGNWWRLRVLIAAAEASIDIQDSKRAAEVAAGAFSAPLEVGTDATS